MSKHLQNWYTIILLFQFEIGFSSETYIRINKSATKEIISVPEELWVFHICWTWQFILLYARVGMRFKSSLGCNVAFCPCPDGNIFLHLSVAWFLLFMERSTSIWMYSLLSWEIPLRDLNIWVLKFRFSLCLYSMCEMYKAKLSMPKSKVSFFLLLKYILYKRRLYY